MYFINVDDLPVFPFLFLLLVRCREFGWSQATGGAGVWRPLIHHTACPCWYYNNLLHGLGPYDIPYEVLCHAKSAWRCESEKCLDNMSKNLANFRTSSDEAGSSYLYPCLFKLAPPPPKKNTSANRLGSRPHWILDPTFLAPTSGLKRICGSARTLLKGTFIMRRGSWQWRHRWQQQNSTKKLKWIKIGRC
jgi:hypothetical protein